MSAGRPKRARPSRRNQSSPCGYAASIAESARNNRPICTPVKVITTRIWLVMNVSQPIEVLYVKSPDFHRRIAPPIGTIASIAVQRAGRRHGKCFRAATTNPVTVSARMVRPPAMRKMPSTTLSSVVCPASRYA